MTLSKTIFSLFAFFALIVSTAFAADHIKYQFPKANLWELKTKPQDQAALTEKNGVLELSFKVKTDESYQAGHLSFNQAIVRLLLKKPIELKKNQQRVLYEVKGMHKFFRGKTGVMLKPLFRDQNGEELVYAPVKQESLGEGSWAAWKTHSIYSTEAGGASTGSFIARGGDGNSWPDGRMTFLGFELTVRAKKEINYQDKIEFGGFTLAPERMPYQDPYFYADAFIKKPGKYRIGLQVRRAFQGVPVRESVQNINFDPKNPNSARQKIFLKLGPRDNYWVRYQITDATGKVVAGNQVRAWVENNPNATATKPVDQNTPPPVGCLRLNPGHSNRGVYERKEKPTLCIRAFASRQASYQVSWRVERYAFPELVAEGKQDLNFNGKPFIDATISPKLPPECDAFRLIAEAKNSEGKVLDQQEYLFGRKSDLNYRYKNREGKRITREQLKKYPYNRMTYLPTKNNRKIKFSSRKESVDRFTDSLKAISQITPNVTISIDLRDFAVLPGVYDFDLLDQMLDAATDQNCRLTLRLSHGESGGKFHWQRYWPQISYDGTVGPYHHFYGSFSPADTKFIDYWLAGFKALHDRYQDHPAFQGYQLFELSGETSVNDRPYAGSIVTYEKCALPMFVEYLKKNVTSDLAKLNKRWGTSYKSWDEVRQPQPDLKNGPTPDMRPQWYDFCLFKNDLANGHWYRTAANSIRSYDPDSIIMIYRQDAGAFENLDSLKNVDFFHGGGNHELEGEGSLIKAWEKYRIGWITEPHHPHRWAAYGDPGDKGWLLDWTTYIMLAQAGSGGANMHIYYFPIPGREDLNLTAHYGREYAYDRWEKWQPLLTEMHDITLLQKPAQIGVMQDPVTLFCKHRTVFTPRLFDLRRWFELIKDDAVDFEDFRQDHAANYKLLIPNVLDQVMSDKNIKRVGDFVRAGGKAVISAATGSKCPGRPGVSFALLKELGINPPDKPFDTAKESVEANVTTSNPFFANDKQVPFFSVADMKRELRSPDMKGHYQQWPFRWLPQTNYFGYYPGVRNVNGQVLAKFADAGAALSLHKCGKGEVLVFWGMPDYSSKKMKGFMQNAAKWAGVDLSRQNSPVPLTMEANHKVLNRHYALMWQGTPGTYKQKLPQVPDGEFFIDDLVSEQRLGAYKAKELREGIELTWIKGYSPFKILRMIPYKDMGSRWKDQYQKIKK